MKDAFNKYLLRKNSKNILKDKIRLNREKKGLMHLLMVFSFNNKKFKDWFFEKSSPIFFNQKRYFKKFHQSNLKEIGHQGLFNFSTKLFLENCMITIIDIGISAIHL